MTNPSQPPDIRGLILGLNLKPKIKGKGSCSASADNIRAAIQLELVKPDSEEKQANLKLLRRMLEEQ